MVVFVVVVFVGGGDGGVVGVDVNDSVVDVVVSVVDVVSVVVDVVSIG